MRSRIEQLLAECRTAGVLVDANLLLLYVVGVYDPSRIEQFNRNSTRTVEDFELLNRFLGHFQTVATTPPVLTEVSNFLGHLPEGTRRGYTELFCRLIPEFDVTHHPSEELCEHPYFRQFRLTDTGIAEVSEDTYLVVTDDLPLYHRLASDEQQDAINFNHLRTANW
jgi:hypothetical protein